MSGSTAGLGRQVEHRAELLTIVLGLGLFGARATSRPELDRGQFRATSLGGMEPAEYSYALAYNAWLNGERAPSWVNALDTAYRAEFERAIRYLDQVAEERA